MESTSLSSSPTLLRKSSTSENQMSDSTDSSIWQNDSEALGDSEMSLTYLPQKQEEERIKRLTTRERVINELLTTENDFVVCFLVYFI